MGAAWLLWLAGCADPVGVLDPGGAAGDTAPTDTAPTDTAPTDTAPPDTGGDPIEEIPGSDSAWDPDAPLELCINEFMPDNQSVLALEDGSTPDWVELHNPGKEAVGLAGWTMSEDAARPDDHRLDPSLSIEPGAFLLLYADNPKEPDPLHLGFSLSSEGGELGLYAPDGRGQRIVYGTVGGDFSVQRVSDCCTGDGCLDFSFRGTPGASNVPPTTTETELVGLGATWSWWDQGSDPGEGWAGLDFDDALWASGPAPLGFGDAHIASTVDGGDESARHVTTWFRLGFEASAAPAGAELVVELMVDDGAAVYLNGVELLRQNLGEGALSTDTLADASVADGAETSTTTYTVDAAALVDGDNLLAAEVHQATLTSSDLGFDLGLGLRVTE
jgi:hypothetical protein